MTAEADLEWRPIEPARVREWASLLAAIEAVDRLDEHVGESELLEDFSDPDLDFARGSMAVYDGELMIGNSVVQTRTAADPAHDMRLSGGVDPAYRGRGIGWRLLDWAEQAAVSLHKAQHPGHPLSLNGEFPARNDGAVALFSARGYKPSRWFHRMACDLSTDIAENSAPAGVEIVGFTLERSQDARLVRNEAFRDHWGSVDTTEASWAHFVGFDALRPAFSFLAYRENEPLGVIIGHEYDSYTQATGRRDMYIPLVGTRRAGRNRGIASALLARALAAAKADGVVAASLDVDADSPTGALGLYQRAGFTVTDVRVTYTKSLAPA